MKFTNLKVGTSLFLGFALVLVLLVAVTLVGAVALQDASLVQISVLSIILVCAATWGLLRLGRLRSQLTDKAADLKESEERFSWLFNANPLPAVCLDQNGQVMDANDAAVGIFGRDRADVIGKRILELGVVHQYRSFVEAREKAVASGILTGEKLQFVTPGGPRDFLVYCKAMTYRGERCSVVMFVDETERNARDVEMQLAAAAFESNVGIVVTDRDATILLANRAHERITGFKSKYLVGKIATLFDSDQHSRGSMQSVQAALLEHGSWEGESWHVRRNGEPYPRWLNIAAIKDADGNITRYVGTIIDISDRKQAESKINKLAFYDQLTGLPNRAALVDCLRQAMEASAETGSYGGLLCVDLDRFKLLNDTSGRDKGDELLRQVTEAMKTCLRDSDTLARLWSNQFAVIVAGLGADKAGAAAKLEAVVEKIRATLHATFTLGSVEHPSSASIGATSFCDASSATDVLLMQAEIAMHKAKDEGRNTYRIFDPEMESSLLRRVGMETDLRRALEHDEFELYFQAQVCGGDEIVGAEALLRWHHPVRGIVSPIEFIPVAESTGLIVPLGRWVLESACRTLSQWMQRPQMARLTLAVNVSVSQFMQGDFVDHVVETLRVNGANPHHLKLELTESLFVQDVEIIIEKMNLLGQHGIRFSLDDFGTGYSSLYNLKRLPLYQLKIDRSFVRDILDDSNDAVIARTVINLARSLELAVIAEGVETGEQRDFLASEGCPSYQGFLFSQPVPIAEFEELADAQHRQSLVA